MRYGFLQVALLLAFVPFAPALFTAEVQNRNIPTLEGERWWAGVISESHRMPLTRLPWYRKLEKD